MIPLSLQKIFTNLDGAFTLLTSFWTPTTRRKDLVMDDQQSGHLTCMKNLDPATDCITLDLFREKQKILKDPTY